MESDLVLYPNSGHFSSFSLYLLIPNVLGNSLQYHYTTGVNIRFIFHQ